MTLREFVRQFRGLTPTKAAKEVCNSFTNILRLTSFEDHPELVVDLLKAMQEHSTPPTPHVLGLVGSDHFRAKFEEWYGVERFWYKKATGMDNMLPFTVEVAIAETDKAREIFYGSNFSPTLDTPIQTRLGLKPPGGLGQVRSPKWMHVLFKSLP